MKRRPVDGYATAAEANAALREVFHILMNTNVSPANACYEALKFLNPPAWEAS